MKKDFAKDNSESLEVKLDQLVSDAIVKKKSQSIIYLLLRHKFFADNDDIYGSFTDGPNDSGVDAVLIVRNREHPEVHIFQSKVHEKQSRRKRNPFKASEIRKICTFFEILKNLEADLDVLVNPVLKQKILEIRQLNFPVFQVWLVSNGESGKSEEINANFKPLADRSIKLNQFHENEFIEFFIKRTPKRIQVQFNARDTIGGVLEFGPTNLKSVVGFISARSLFDLIKDLSDSSRIDYTFFDINIRGFLGLENTFNREIYSSAVSRENYYFSALNNGITMTCTDVKVDRNVGDQPRILAKNMSIVNGAQTCSAIFDAMAESREQIGRFDNLSILFRIFATEDKNLIEKIAIATNSQNRVSFRDIKANDPLQFDLEKKLFERGIVYKRKRGIVGFDSTSGNELDALRAGQIMLAFVHKDPVSAKRNSDDIFSEYYQKIFNGIDVEKLITGFKLYQNIEREFLKYSILEQDKRDELDYTFITYGSYHVLSLCAAILDVEPNAIENESHLIRRAISIIDKRLKDSSTPQAFYNFFRNSKVANDLIDSISQPDLFKVN